MQNLLAIIIVLSGAFFVFFVVIPKKSQPEKETATESSIPLTASSENSETSSAIPLSDTSTIQAFFSFINQKKISEAVTMLSPEMIKDDAAKQAWGGAVKCF